MEKGGKCVQANLVGERWPSGESRHRNAWMLNPRVIYILAIDCFYGNRLGSHQEKKVETIIILLTYPIVCGFPLT